MGISYRVRQFWRTVSINIDPAELDQINALLSPEQWQLFSKLQPGEINHSVTIFSKLLEQGENQADLLVAALMHDVGKLRYRLNPLERALVVVVKALKPAIAQRWGAFPPEGWDNLPGWRKAFILAEQHAEWGAELAHQVGVSPQAETLIRLHHYPQALLENEMETSLLHKLWLVDNQS